MRKAILKRKLPLGLNQAWSFSGKNTHSLFWKLPWGGPISRGLDQGLRAPSAPREMLCFKPVFLVPLSTPLVHPISLLLPEVLGVHEHRRRERLKLWPQAWQSRQVSLEGVGMAVL